MESASASARGRSLDAVTVFAAVAAEQQHAPCHRVVDSELLEGMEVGAPLLVDEGLQRGAVDLLRAVERTRWPDRPVDARVEQEELRMGGHAAFGSLGEDRVSLPLSVFT